MTSPAGVGSIGILGGTFDPPHLAHLAIAEEAREVLGLSTVLFMPAGQPWQKVDSPVSPGRLRLAMVEQAIAGNPFFRADPREVDRAGPTYTAETIAEVAAETGAEPWFILSAEALAGLPTWRDPERILALARLCVVPRGAAPEAAIASFRALYPAAANRITVLDLPRLAISSTAIRARVRAGRSIRYLVPDTVAALITEYALYVADPAPVPAPADV
ncbi:MAG: nicotinate-nucleotide adenylyltransferase [Chloroflexota bacterium]